MNVALLPDRGVVKVAGPAACAFLNGILTTEITTVTRGAARYAALLTAQGKIVVDFIVVQGPNGRDEFLLECPRSLARQLVERLGFYRLRAKVTIEDVSETTAVLAAWNHDGASALACDLAYQDPRLGELGLRLLSPVTQTAELAAKLGSDFVDAALYEAHRIKLGVPRGGLDFIYGETFPHEADMDQLGGIDFSKGCYVGQEVVSRMEHRGSARTRIVQILTDAFAPDAGLPVMAGERRIGTTGSGVGPHSLAMLRLDRLADALQSGTHLDAGGVTVRAVKPSWARFDFPQEASR